MGVYGFVLILLGSSLSLLSSAARGEVFVSGKQLYMVYETVDGLMGTYVFLVTNDGSEPVRATLPVMLPQETVDFRALNGIGADELKLGKNGGLTLDKSYKVGDSFVSVGFRVPASGGRAEMTFKPERDVQSMSIFLSAGSQLEVSDKKGLMDRKTGVNFGNGSYDTYTKTDVKKGEPQVFWIDGVPRGRGPFYLMGWITGFLMLILTTLIAYKTRPRLGLG